MPVDTKKHASEAQLASQLLLRWRDDPVLFASEALGKTLWSRQVEMARSVVVNRRTAVKSGHKTGKSFVISVLSLWWCLTRPNGRVILTAPAFHQVTNILWPEVRGLYRNSKFSIGGEIYKAAASGLQLGGGRGIFCVTTDQPVKMAGLSGPNQLIIVDEASGYPQAMWDPIKGNLAASGGRLLAMGNPTQTSGEFYDAFTTMMHMWNTMTVSSVENPNFVLGNNDIPGLMNRIYAIEALDEHAGIKLPMDASAEMILQALDEVGDKSPYINTRILGLFPTESETAVVPLGAVNRGADRWHETPDEGDSLQIGVDPARYGDDESVIAPRRGNLAHEVRAYRGLNGPDLAGKVVETIAELRRKDEPVVVKIDAIGVGASPFDILSAQAEKLEITVYGINAAAASYQPDKYHNIRAQLQFAVRDWLDAGGALPPDKKLHGELVAAQFSYDPQGRRLIEDKKEIKKRLKGSPDRADPLALAVFDLAPIDMRLAYIPSER